MKNFDLGVSDFTGSSMRVAVSHSDAAGEVGPFEVAVPTFAATELAHKNDAELRAIATEFTRQVLPDAIWQAWQASLAAAGDKGIRFRIRCKDAACVRLPWELLYDPDRRSFLAHDPHSPVVRYMEGPIPSAAQPIEGAVRMLLTCASPSDEQALAVAAELERIEAGLSDAIAAGRLAVTRRDALTADALVEALISVKPHLFHFSGHAEWNEAEGEGFLKLENGSGKTEKLTSYELARLLRNRGVALVVLNACETGVGGYNWAGLASALVLAGIPSVVAMQMPVSDGAATVFAGTLYRALANDYRLEEAVVLARQHTANLGEDLADPGEWLAPALFMRTGGEQLWLREQTDKPTAAVGGMSIGTVNAVNVAETQFIDQRGSKIVTGDRNVVADRIENSDIYTGDCNVNTGGGAYVGGNVTAGGDFVGRDKIVSGGGGGEPDLSKAFTKLAASVALEATSDNLDGAMALVKAIQLALAQGEDEQVAGCVADLAEMAPEVKGALQSALSQAPLSERIGQTTRFVLGRLE